MKRLYKLFAVVLWMLVLTAIGHPAGAQDDTGQDRTALVEAAATGTKGAYTLPAQKLEQARELGRIRTALSFGYDGWGMCALVLLLATGRAARLGRWAEGRWMEGQTRREWVGAGIFALVLAVGLFLVVNLPFAAAGHAYSRLYGISVENWAAWMADEAKMLGLTVLVEAPILMLVYGLMRWRWSQRGFWARQYWAWAALGMVPLMLLGTFLLPQLIEPLFYDFAPLAASHPALAADLEKVVARTGTAIPVDRIFLMKASAKSNGLNAYVSGFGASKRIVVWDTTADRMPEDEILFTFGHEAGHYVLRHIPQGLGLASVGVFALFGLTAGLAEWLWKRHGARWGIARMASLPGLVVLMLALSVMQFLSEPVEAAISRRFEHEADVYGMEAVHGIVADPRRTAVRAFKRLGEAYLEDPEPNAFVVFWSYDHPPIRDRVRFAAGYDPWRAGERPRFFRGGR